MTSHIEGTGPVRTEAPLLAKHENVSVVGIADGGKLPSNMLDAIVGPDGSFLPYVDFPVAGNRSDSAAFIRVSTV